MKELFENLLRLEALPRARVSAAQFGFYRRSARRKRDRLAKLLDGQIELSFLQVGLPQVSVRHDETRVELQSIFFFLNGPVIVAGQVVTPADVGVDDQRPRINLPGQLDFREGFLSAAKRGESQCIPVYGGRVTWIQGDGALEFTLHTVPFEMVKPNGGQGSVGLGQTLIELQSLLRSGFRLRDHFRGRPDLIVAEIEQTVREAGISGGVRGVFGNRLPEVSDGVGDSRRSALFRFEPAPQVRFVGFR